MKNLSATILSILIGISCFAVPDYSFTNPVRISGTNLQVGSRYRFSNVKAGTDAIVTIVQFTGGVTLTSIDDGSAGYPDAFQPYVVSPAFSNGYAEFRIDFVITGTATPMIQLQVPTTPLDVDGDVFPSGNLYEFDIISLNPTGYYIDYDMVGSEITFTETSNWIIGRNSAAINYSGIDSTRRNVMFSAVNSNISTLTMRLGAQNLSNASNNRRKSIFFQRFTYANSHLSKSSLISFSGVERYNSIDLKWQLESDHLIRTITLEKTNSSKVFEPVMHIWVNEQEKNNIDFKYQDRTTDGNDYLYRLKMTAVDGKIYYSNVLAFRKISSTTGTFRVYPTIIESSTTINVKTQNSGTALFQLIDYTGKVILQRNVAYENGSNNIRMHNLGSINKGYYIAMLRIGNSAYSQNLYKQ